MEILNLFTKLNHGTGFFFPRCIVWFCVQVYAETFGPVKDAVIAMVRLDFLPNS
jgi:hypothetical protein